MQLGFTQKMAISIASFLVPICALSFLLFKSQTGNIDFAKKEFDGNTYQRPLENLLKEVSIHKILAQRALHGDTRSKGAMLDLQSNIDKHIQELTEIDGQLGILLDFTREGLAKRKRDGNDLAAFQSEWMSLKGNAFSFKPEDSNDKHTKVIGILRTMITHLGDTSNLILDPDLDSYYLVDMSLSALPQTEDRIQDIIVTLEPMIRKQQINAASKAQIAVYAAMLKESDISRVVGDAQTSLNEDSNFYGTSPSLQKTLPGAVERYQKSNEALQKLLTEVIDADSASLNINKFIETTNMALEQAYDLQALSQNELDVLLQNRIHVLSTERLRNLTIVLITMLAASALAIQITISLRRTILNVSGNLSSSASSVGTSSEDLSTASQSLSEATVQSAASLEESVASIEEVSEMVKATAQHSKKVNEVSAIANQLVIEGVASVEKVVAQMNRISTDSKKIEDIIVVIEDIAFQTNLLALNASVEAARAGEGGKGFAVVADSIRSLAQRSSAEAEGIRELIQENVQTVAEGTQLGKKASEGLGRIVGSMKEVAGLNLSIAEACAEQSNSLSQVAEAINQLDQTTQANASSSKEIASAAENLLEENETMKTQVHELSKVIGLSANRKAA